MVQRTLAIIKPDAVKKKLAGKILQRIEEEGFEIVNMRLVRMTGDNARAFYIVHKDKPFYPSLTEFMSSGPVVVMELEREDAIAHWRQTMGATDPSQAKPGSLRRSFGFSVERNAVHGSDAPETAAVEIKFFFA